MPGAYVQVRGCLCANQRVLGESVLSFHLHTGSGPGLGFPGLQSKHLSPLSRTILSAPLGPGISERPLRVANIINQFTISIT